MKKLTLAKLASFVMIVIIAASCQNDEPLKLNSAICTTCPVFDPGGGVIVTCIGPDLVVNSVISYGTTGNVMNYGVSIKNIGNSPATLNYTTNAVYWQAWLSTDGVTRNVAACGKTFPATTLDVNQITWTSINCTFPATVNFNNYHYMIVDLHVPAAVGECNANNNTYVRSPLPL